MAILLLLQEKCAQYWPALMDTPWNVGGELSVTLQLQTQFAAYRVKKILLENVCPKSEVVGIAIYAVVPKGSRTKGFNITSSDNCSCNWL
jgi:hypothetical protein